MENESQSGVTPDEVEFDVPEPMPEAESPSETEAPKLEDQVQRNREDIDQLWIAVGKQKKGPWYRNPTILIASLALALSFLTTSRTFVREGSADRSAKDAELHELVSKLQELAVLNASTYGSQAVEESRLALEALKNLNEVDRPLKPIECLLIASSLRNTNQYKEATEVAHRGLATECDLRDEASLLSVLADATYVLEGPAAGREIYEQALNLGSKYPEVGEVDLTFVDFFTMIYWVDAEIRVGDCEEARKRFEVAMEIVGSGTPPLGMKNMMIESARPTEERLNTYCGLADGDAEEAVVEDEGHERVYGAVE